MSVAKAVAADGAVERLDDSLERAIRDIGIPPRPAVLADLGERINAPEPDFGELARLIESDVALAAGIMKVANSPWFGRRVKARTVHQATVALGLDLTARTITGLMLRRAFPHTPSLDRFWDASARVAQLSGWLTGRLDLGAGIDFGEAYTFGLFRDCGIAVLLSRLPDYERTLAIANVEAQRPFTAVEDARHPCNHAQVGSQLARSWHLPEATTLAIRYHHDIAALLVAEPAMPGDSAQLIAVAQLAERLFQELSGLSQGREWDKLGAACRAVLDISPRYVSDLVEQARRLETDF